MLDDFQNENDENKNGDFLDEFRQRLNSQPIENFEDRKNEINRSQHVFLGTILGVGLAGVVSWFMLSPNYENAPDAEIPVIRRPQAAIKVQPAEPGGMEILNQDKTVYDIVEKKDTPDIKVENLLPPPEEPKIIAIENKNLTAEQAVSETENIIKNAEKIIASEEDKSLQTKNIQSPKETEIQPTVKEEIKVVVKETPKKEQPIQIVQTIAQPEDKPIDAPSGSWQIQLISSPNKAAMEKAWIDMTKKYSALKDLSHEVESADLGSKGTFYRLKAGAFKTRGEADKLCNSIKSAGGSCLVKKKQ